MPQADLQADNCIQPALCLDDARRRFERGGTWRVPQVARMLGLSRRRVYSLIDEGKLRHERIGRCSLRVRGEWVIEYLDGIAKVV